MKLIPKRDNYGGGNPPNRQTPAVAWEELRRRLDEQFDANPDAPIDEIVRNAKGNLGAGSPADTRESVAQADQAKKPGNKTLLYLGLGVVLLLLLGAVIFFALRQWGDEPIDPEPTATEPLQGVVTSAASVILFDPPPAASIPAGQQAQFFIQVRNTAGTPVPDIPLMASLSSDAFGSLTATELRTGPDGTAVIGFDATAPGDVTISVRSNDGQNLLSQHTLTVGAPPPNLAVGLKAGEVLPTSVAVGKTFTVTLELVNTGSIIADNVYLLVDTPQGLTAVNKPSSALCANIGDSTTCTDNGQLGVGGKASASLAYQAAQSGTYTLTPRLSIDGGATSITTGKPLTITVEDPVPSAVTIAPELAEVGTNSQTVISLTVTILDQWRNEYAGEARVSVDFARTTAPTEDAPTPLEAGFEPIAQGQEAIMCTVNAANGILLTASPTTPQEPNDPNGAPAGPTQQLPQSAEAIAWAYDTATESIFIVSTTDPEQQGWFSRQESGEGTQISCTNGDNLSNLPAAPPDGYLLARTQPVNQQGTFHYRAGSWPGQIEFTAWLTERGPEAASEKASLSLLPMGRLGPSTAPHLYNAPTAVGGKDENTIVLYRIGDTPLEMYPQDESAPEARRVAVRIWVPETALGFDEAGGVFWGDGGLTNILATNGNEASVPEASGDPPDLSLQAGARQAPVQVLDRATVNDINYVQIRLIGWVAAGDISSAE